MSNSTNKKVNDIFSMKEIIDKIKDKKPSIIYAFNGVGKTRLSKAFINSVDSEDNEYRKVLSFNAYIEECFYWEYSTGFAKLVVKDDKYFNLFVNQGKFKEIRDNFTRYINKTNIILDYEEINDKRTEVIFRFKKINEIGETKISEPVKISKGEESCFIWSVFYSYLTYALNTMSDNEENKENKSEKDKEYDEIHSFDEIEYVFIDDPVTSLDENHLIHIANDLGKFIKNYEEKLQALRKETKQLSEEIKKLEENKNQDSQKMTEKEREELDTKKEKEKELITKRKKFENNKIKFIVTTHNSLFFRILKEELNEAGNLFFLSKKENSDESWYFESIKPKNLYKTSYTNFLVQQIDSAINNGNIYRYHFNHLRSIAERIASLLGYKDFEALMHTIELNHSLDYGIRMMKHNSHLTLSEEELSKIPYDHKELLKILYKSLLKRVNYNLFGEEKKAPPKIPPRKFRSDEISEYIMMVEKIIQDFKNHEEKEKQEKIHDFVNELSTNHPLSFYYNPNRINQKLSNDSNEVVNQENIDYSKEIIQLIPNINEILKSLFNKDKIKPTNDEIEEEINFRILNQKEKELINNWEKVRGWFNANGDSLINLKIKKSNYIRSDNTKLKEIENNILTQYTVHCENDQSKDEAKKFINNSLNISNMPVDSDIKEKLNIDNLEYNERTKIMEDFKIQIIVYKMIKEQAFYFEYK